MSAPASMSSSSQAPSGGAAPAPAAAPVFVPYADKPTVVIGWNPSAEEICLAFNYRARLIPIRPPQYESGLDAVIRECTTEDVWVCGSFVSEWNLRRIGHVAKTLTVCVKSDREMKTMTDSLFTQPEGPPKNIRIMRFPETLAHPRTTRLMRRVFKPTGPESEVDDMFFYGLLNHNASLRAPLGFRFLMESWLEGANTIPSEHALIALGEVVVREHKRVAADFVKSGGRVVERPNGNNNDNGTLHVCVVVSGADSIVSVVAKEAAKSADVGMVVRYQLADQIKDSEAMGSTRITFFSYRGEEDLNWTRVAPFNAGGSAFCTGIMLPGCVELATPGGLLDMVRGAAPPSDSPAQ